jgi:hypothetical protein
MSATPLYVPAASIERLAIDNVTVAGLTDPTSLAVRTCLTPYTGARSTAPTTGWAAATWSGTSTVVTHLITGRLAGAYVLWLEIARGDETIKFVIRDVILT